MRVAGVVLFALLLLAPGAAAQTQLWGLANTAQILIGPIDITTGAFTDSVPVTESTGAAVDKGTGLATDPTTGTMWCVLGFKGQPQRVLATIDPNTGVAVTVGNLGDKFAGITFEDDGSLWAITGDGASQPSSLFTVDKGTAAATLRLALDAGDDGETIAYRPDDGLIYRISGRNAPVFQSIDPVTLGVSPIVLSGIAIKEGAALLRVPGGGFLLTVLGEWMYDLSATGLVSNGRSQNPWVFKGIAFGPVSTSVAPARWTTIKARYR